jgi:Ca2+-binding EF-hand superfamily protein
MFISCRNNLEEKGFPVTSATSRDDEDPIAGIAQDSLTFPTRPSSVLLTGIPKYRLATVYKVNFNKDSTTFIGSNDFHYNYESIGENDGNHWHNNYLPGLEAVYGYNLVNVSLFNTETQTQKNFFEKPVLIRTVYYPSFSKDTLSYKPISRNYFMISVHDEDTNGDGFINVNDLRRLYSFDINAENKKAVVPADYSVYKSEYDPANDFVYIFARFDANKNGQIEDLEPVDIFWVELKNPEVNGKSY